MNCEQSMGLCYRNGFEHQVREHHRPEIDSGYAAGLLAVEKGEITYAKGLARLVVIMEGEAFSYAGGDYYNGRAGRFFVDLHDIPERSQWLVISKWWNKVCMQTGPTDHFVFGFMRAVVELEQIVEYTMSVVGSGLD